MRGALDPLTAACHASHPPRQYPGRSMSHDAPLTPAEAAVLLSPNLIRGAAALKATLLFLLATGVLRIEETEHAGFFRRRKVAHLKIAAARRTRRPKSPRSSTS
ncbi:MAG TPA: hypothetical protein VKS78_06075 [Roseiarcus sp.]|nr:hypothetical protein [Roseiarcus sp.]